MAAALMEKEIASDVSVSAAASAVTEWETSGRRHGDTSGGVPAQDEQDSSVGWLLLVLRVASAMSDLAGDVPAGYVWGEGVLAGAIDIGTVPVNGGSRSLHVMYIHR